MLGRAEELFPAAEELSGSAEERILPTWITFLA